MYQFGCEASVYYSIPSLFLIDIPPTLLSVIASLYAATAFYRFLRRRTSLSELLQKTSSGFNGTHPLHPLSQNSRVISQPLLSLHGIDLHNDHPSNGLFDLVTRYVSS